MATKIKVLLTPSGNGDTIWLDDQQLLDCNSFDIYSDAEHGNTVTILLVGVDVDVIG